MGKLPVYVYPQALKRTSGLEFVLVMFLIAVFTHTHVTVGDDGGGRGQWRGQRLREASNVSACVV